ncbi:MAG: family 10 glycosylhydrolase, partial [Verrucomicrobiae bacterium]|nr:family 10 glycosylhydrolase [Verrucomicrobiae bacterium]
MRKIKGGFRVLLLATVFGCLSAFTGGCGKAEKKESANTPVKAEKAYPTTEIRAVWVSVLAEGLKSPEEIRELVATVRKANMNTIVAQVHREGATMFPSEIQPRHASVRDKQEFDPLATLLKEARDTSGGKQQLAVHAWFNTFKIGEQKDYLDSSPVPIAVEHPEWFTRNHAGTVQYELEQGVPAVQQRIISVIEECLKNYDVDGINLDFVRYFGNDRGYNPFALKRFVEQTGFVGRPAVDDPVWSDFRREQVTNFVKRCAIAVWTYRPGAIMSVDATGWGPAPQESFADTRPYYEALQDWGGWVEKGFVDLVLRMGYKREWVADQKQEYRDWADYTVKLIESCDGRMLTTGIGGHFNPMEDTLNQYREALKRGLGTCLFSYDRPTQEGTDSDGSLRGAANPAWEIFGTEIYPEKAGLPSPDWRNDRAFIAGYLKDVDGNPVDHGAVKLVNSVKSTNTDGNGFFAFFDLDPG